MSKDSRWSVYILRCADGSLYTGVTTDTLRRLDEHNESDKGARYTKSRRPVSLVYSRVCESKQAAYAEEYRIKKLSKKEKEKLIVKEASPQQGEEG